MTNRKPKCSFCKHPHVSHLANWDTMECSKCPCAWYLGTSSTRHEAVRLLAETARNYRATFAAYQKLILAHSSCDKVKVQCDAFDEERRKWESLGRSAASLLLGYFSVHNKDVALLCSCGLCQAALNCFESYGLQIMTQEQMERILQQRTT